MNRMLVENRARRSEAGYTLIELLVVLAILGFLAAIATVQVIRSLDRRHWCPVVLVPGGVGSVCRGSVLTVPSVVKKRRATCPQCLAAFEV